LIIDIFNLYYIINFNNNILIFIIIIIIIINFKSVVYFKFMILNFIVLVLYFVLGLSRVV